MADVADVSPGIFARTRRALALSGWLGLAWGVAVGIAAAHPELVGARMGLPPETRWILVGGAALGGLFVSLVAGLLLRGSLAMLRWVTAMLAFVISQQVTLLTYGALNGIEVYAAVASPWVAALPLLLGSLVVAMGVRIGRTRRVRTASDEPAAHAVTAEPAARQRRAGRAASAPTPRGRVGELLAKLHLPDVRLPSLSLSAVPVPDIRRPGTGTRRPVRRPQRGQVQVGRRRPLRTPRQRPRTRANGRRRHSVKLGSEAVNVCPFCLEEVLPRDPRGVVKCDICGAPHHGDCWAVTGKCEVPHLKT